MGYLELLLISVSLAMDAFAVSVCKGLSVEKTCKKHYFIVGAWFGVFQALMPLIGYFLGLSFAKFVNAIDHWLAFALLILIGVNMLKEAFSKTEVDQNDSFAFVTMLILAIATSIDALAVGITMALNGLQMNIFIAVSIIGIVTFFISALGYKIGNLFGIKYKSKAEAFGGIVLIALAVKILIEGLI